LQQAEPDEFEASVAQELLNLEMTSDLKSSLRDLYITAAKEVDCSGGRKAIILYVPFKLLKSFNKIHQRIVRELEKSILEGRYSSSLSVPFLESPTPVLKTQRVFVLAVVL
jgi:Ribosomal protein S7e.